MLSTLGKIFNKQHFVIFSPFSQETRVDISCKLSPVEMSNPVFLAKSKKTINNLLSAESAYRMVTVIIILWLSLELSLQGHSSNCPLHMFWCHSKITLSLTRASALRVTNIPRRHHFLIIKYFKVNDNDTCIRQNSLQCQSLNDTDLSSQVQLFWSKKSSRHKANLLGHKI